MKGTIPIGAGLALILSCAAGAIGTPSDSGAAPSPTISDVAGGPGSGTALQIGQSPYYFAVSGTQLFVSDLVNNVIRRMDLSTGSETALAGDTYPGFAGDGGPATAAELNQPAGIAADGSGDVFFVDQNDNRVREVPARSGTFFNVAMTAGDIYTVAGNGTAGFAGDGGPATSAEMRIPEGLALDSSGDLFVADSYNGRVREIAAATHVQFGVAMTAGDMYTVAGTGQGGNDAVSGDGGPAGSAGIGTPQGVSISPSGDLFVTQDLVTTALKPIPGPVREIAASAHSQFGITMNANDIYTVAGITDSTVCGTSGPVGDGGPAIQATLCDPVDAVTDASGDLIITDYYDNRVREVSPSGSISTAAGNGSPGYAGNGGPATSADLSFPTGLGFDATGALIVSDSSSIRSISPSTHVITQIAGNLSFTFSGDGGQAIDAQMGAPIAITPAPGGSFFIADAVNNVVREVSTGGNIQTVAGNGFGVGGLYAKGGFGGDGGPATAALLSLPTGLAADSSDDLLIADAGNNRIREITASDGDIATVAGTGTRGSSGDGGSASRASLDEPAGVALDGRGDIFIAELLGNRIREIPAASGTFFGVSMKAGDIYTVAGTGTAGYNGDGGPARAAEINAPFSVAVDGAGNLIEAEKQGGVVRIIAAKSGTFFGVSMKAGDIYTVAGTGTAGYSGDGGPATAAELSKPGGVSVDSAGNLWISDAGNHRIRMVETHGTITTVVGNGTSGFTGDGGDSTSATLGIPEGIAVDASGNLLVTELSRESSFGYVDATGSVQDVASAAAPGLPLPPPPPAPSGSSGPGYWMVDSAGDVFSFGTAAAFGSATNLGSVNSMASMPSGAGYWVADSAGFVDAFGAAKDYTLSSQPSGSVVTIASSPDGGGYWLATTTGQVLTAGDAGYFGSMAGTPLKAPIVNMAPTPDGGGYWLLGADGGVFTFGDAGYFGSTGAIVLNKPAVAMSPTADGSGYWFVASDGGVFTFGDAGYFGSMGGTVLNKPVNGIVTTSDGAGYWMVASDGGVFSFGDAGFVGSLGANPPRASIVGFAPV